MPTWLTVTVNVVVVLMYGGTGLWCVLFPDAYLGSMGTSIDSELGRSELRVLGGVYLSLGVLALGAQFRPERRPDYYKVLLFVMTSALVARTFSFAYANFEPQVLAQTVTELLLLGFAWRQLRQLGAAD